MYEKHTIPDIKTISYKLQVQRYGWISTRAIESYPTADAVTLLSNPEKTVQVESSKAQLTEAFK